MGRMRQRALKIRKHERSLANHRSHDEYQSDERGSEYAYEDDQGSFLKIAWAVQPKCQIVK